MISRSCLAWVIMNLVIHFTRIVMGRNWTINWKRNLMLTEIVCGIWCWVSLVFFFFFWGGCFCFLWIYFEYSRSCYLVIFSLWFTTGVWNIHGFHFCEVSSSSLSKACRIEHCTAFFWALCWREHFDGENKMLKGILSLIIQWISFKYK